MRTVLLFTLAAAVCVAVGWWVADLPGTFTATVNGTTFQANAPVALTLLALLFVILYVVIRLIAALFRSPKAARRRNREKRRIRGETAINRTLVALAGNDVSIALRQSQRSRRLLGDTPLTLLLAAQADRQAGREDDAGGVYKLLADRPDAQILGLRGLLRQAMAKQDWQEAAAIAQRAELAHPGTGWLTEERRYIALRNGQWGEALRLMGPVRAQGADKPAIAALSLALSREQDDAGIASKQAKEAWEADPSLAPAATAYAGHLRRTGRERAALDVLRRSWATVPHPAVAAAYLEPITDKLGRTRAAQELAGANPAHPDSALLLAQTALDAGLTGEARRHLETAQKAGLNDRRLYVTQADLADRDNDADAAQEALRHIPTAKPEPTWRCAACGTVHQEWHPVCDACGTPGRIAWTEGEAHQQPAVKIGPPVPSIEGLA